MTFEEQVAQIGRRITKERGAHLFRQGESDRTIYIVKTGLLKAYYLSDDGRESVKSFLLAGDKIGSLKGFMSETGCSFSVVCLEPSELIGVSFDALYARSRDNQAMANEIVDFLLAFGMKKETREYELLCLSAEDRFKRLLEAAPSLLERVTQNDIARYLGVTPVGLSRIKTRLEKANTRRPAA